MGKSHAIDLAKKRAKGIITDIDQIDCQKIVDKIKILQEKRLLLSLIF